MDCKKVVKGAEQDGICHGSNSSDSNDNTNVPAQDIEPDRQKDDQEAIRHIKCSWKHENVVEAMNTMEMKAGRMT